MTLDLDAIILLKYARFACWGDSEDASERTTAESGAANKRAQE